MLLAGDVGGTKTRLGIFSPEKGPLAPLAETVFPSQNYPDLETIVEEFLYASGCPVDTTSLGVAGPVRKGTVKVTNLPWKFSAVGLRRRFDLKKVILLNDLQALGHALPLLDESHLHTVNRGRPDPTGSRAFIAPGTGLGMAYAVSANEGYLPLASEGGHTGFAPATERQQRLLSFLQMKMEIVSIEEVCSGRGISNIYRFLKEAEKITEPAWLARKLLETKDPTPVIVQAALGKRSCPLCRETVNIFLEILAQAAGDLALTLLATGGVYVGGGIVPRLRKYIDASSFMNVLSRKESMSGLLRTIPVKLILNERATLIGAARYGLEMVV
ncbi:MAG: glucokinase [Smithellaceae bacterium]|nr:glucokinase [Smithellaceae bacterium]